jgi:two-component system sensor histidine kinase CreC
MKIGLRIFLGYFLIVGLAGYFVLRVFVGEVKPGVRQAMEDTLVDTANVLAALATEDLRAGRIADGGFARAVDSLGGRNPDASIWRFRKRSVDYRIYVTDARGIVVYDSAKRDVGRDFSRWNDVYLTLRGEYGARSTRTVPGDDASSVMHVAAPVWSGPPGAADRRIIGALTVAKPNARMQPVIDASQRTIIGQGAILLGLSFLVGLAATLWLSRSLASLGRYARAVTAGERAEPPDLGRNEIGELGRALATMRERLDGKQYVEQYVQTLAHEMKSPLAAIRAAVEILETAPDGPDRARFLANIDGQGARLAAMLDKMLALAAVESRQSLSERVPVDLGALLDDAVEALAPRLERRGLRVLREGMLREGVAPTVPGDRFLLGHAVSNLLENALEFSPPGGALEVDIDEADGLVRLRVLDRGPGLPDFARDRVFERFYSLPRPDGARSSGLGLNLVREVALLHGGSASLDNREGGGAVAELRLPLR